MDITFPDNKSLLTRKQESFDFTKLLLSYFRYWYLFLIVLALTMGLAFLKIRYTVPLYQVGSSLYVNSIYSNGYSPYSGTSGNYLQGFGMNPMYQTITSHQIMLRSKSLVGRALRNLNFEVSYFSKGRVKNIELYKASPIRVEWAKDHPQMTGVDFLLTIDSDGTLKLSAEGENITVFDYENKRILRQIPEYEFSKTIKPGELVSTKECSFKIFLTENYNPEGLSDFIFRFHTNGELEDKYLGNLSITADQETFDILYIRLKEQNVPKGNDFLRSLMEVYTEYNLEKKNQYASKTINFIQKQLNIISDSLALSENQMVSFQSRNQAISLSAQGQQLLTTMGQYEKDKVISLAKGNYYQYLKGILETGQEVETIIAPAAMGVNDPVISSLIIEFNKASTERARVLASVQNPEHPSVKKLNAQMENLRSTIITNLTTLAKQEETFLNSINSHIRRIESQLTILPRKEQDLVNLERDFNMNNETYTFLMQRLSEAQIARASNSSDYELIEGPWQMGAALEPQSRKMYTNAFLLGLLLPAFLLLMNMLLYRKIQSEDEVNAMSDFPIVGHIFYNNSSDKSRTMVLDNPNSPDSEPYRAIRNKLNLITKAKEKPVIAVTSTFPKEGKTYNAINIASTFAMMKKKTVLVDLDLRNSKFKKEFDLTSDDGLVTYIIGKSSQQDIIFKTKHPYLHLIPAGPIPPNPGEMLTDDKVTSLIRELKKSYDIIILDSPPVGLVADLYQLRDEIDATLYVIRDRFTHRDGLRISLSEMEIHKMKGVGLLINYIKRKGNKTGYGYGLGHGYGHGYGYGYGYSYGYGNGFKEQKESNRNKLKTEDTNL